MSSDHENDSDSCSNSSDSDTFSYASTYLEYDELSLDAVPTELWMEIITFLHSRDLMHLALSNSRWKPVALEVKWKTKRVPLDALLKTLAPVRHTYGTSHVYYADAVNEDPATIDPARLERFRRLSIVITRLRINVSCDYRLLGLLERLLGSSPVCPAVRHIDLEVSSPVLWDALVSPNVKSLTCVDLGLRILPETMKKLGESCPKIEHMTYEGVSSIHRPAAPAPIIYGAFHNLRVLDHTMAISRSWWRSLHGACPRLEIIHIKVDERKRRRVDEEWGQALQWDSIQELDLDGVGGPSVVEILMSDSTFPNLQKFGFSTALKHEPTNFFRRLAEGSPHLQDLHIRGDVALSHVHQFQSIRHLRFTKVRNVDEFNASTLGATVFRLQELESLAVCPKKSSDGMDRPFQIIATFLRDLARHCPHLRELELPVDACSRFPSIKSYQFTHLRKLVLKPLIVRPENIEPLTNSILELCPAAEVFRVQIQPAFPTGGALMPLLSRIKAWKSEVVEAPGMSRRMEALYFAKQAEGRRRSANDNGLAATGGR